MLSYDEALARILSAAGEPLPAETVGLAEAYGRPLAEAVTAPGDLPPFDNSAVDGYAVRERDTLSFSSPDRYLTVIQTVRAGEEPVFLPEGGTAARVFTGAPIPPGADAVIMQEDTTTEGNRLRWQEPASPGLIRRAGSDVRQGEVVLEAGAVVDAGVIGLLSALNLTQVRSPRRPRVGLLTTGDEVIPPGPEMLRLGQIRDANGPALAAAIWEAGGEIAVWRHARDTEEEVRSALTELAACDLIVSSGGVSVGEYDHVKAIAEELGALDFWRIAIKPGKPLAFGRIGNALFFGLPGNPVSSLVTFELFVRPVLRYLSGHREVLRPQVTASLTTDLEHAPGRREFVRARLHWENGACFATPTGAQGSHRLSSMVGANALLVASEDQGDYSAGEVLPALLLR